MLQQVCICHITGVPDCLPSGNPSSQVTCFKGTTLVDEMTGDVYDYDNKLFISSGNIDHGAVDLQSFLKNEDNK